MPGLVLIGPTTHGPRLSVLAFQTPGDADAFYLDASEPAGDEGDGPVDFARIGAVAAATGATEMLGPPPFSPA